MDAMNDHLSMADSIMDDISDAILKDVNNTQLPCDPIPVVPTDAKKALSPSKTRDGLTIRAATPRSTNQKQKVQVKEASSSLMDQLELLMGKVDSGDVTSPSKSPSRKKKPPVKEVETDDSTRSISEQNDALNSSERSSSKSKSSSTTRSKGELPKIPRSPQRKKKAVSQDITSTGNDVGFSTELVNSTSPFNGLPSFDNLVLDTNPADQQKKVPPSLGRVKPAVKKRTGNDENVSMNLKLADEMSERSAKSSTSKSQVRTKKVVSESETKSSSDPMKSSSERPSRSSSRSRRKEIAPSVANDEQYIDRAEQSEPFLATKSNSFRMEPMFMSTLESKSYNGTYLSVQLPIAEQLDVSIASASVASENDETVSTPLLLQSCERSESLRRSTSRPSELSDDLLDRLQRSSLSDIEKSGIGVERSIKKAIQNARAKKTGASSPSLSCFSSKAQSANADQKVAEFNNSMVLDIPAYVKKASDSEDDYIEEIIDDECDDGEVATMNSSTNLSLVAAEMDEAMTKIWAKFDQKITKSLSDSNLIVETDSDTVDPDDHFLAPTRALVDPNDFPTYDDVKNLDVDFTTEPVVMFDPRTGPTDEIIRNNGSASMVDAKVSVTASVEDIPETTIAFPKTEETTMRMPDDTRLSSLVKLLVVDAWSNDIEKVTSCLEEMRVLCESDENAVTEMFQHGGHLVVIVLMRRHVDIVNVQIAALLTLQKAAECRNEFTDAIIALGALELIIATIKNYDDNEDVVTAGCGALLNLTLPAKHAKVFVFELLGIQTIAHVSIKFPSKIALQKYVLWMIQYFSYWENYKMQIVQQGGMQTLAKMIESFSSMINNDIVPSQHNTTNNNKAAIESIVKSASATMKRLL